jgi:prevent-host-death family protein
MKTVNVHEAKTHLSRLLERAHAGEEIVIAKSGEPYARLVPLSGRQPRRQAGTLKGHVEITDTFFEPLPSDWSGESWVNDRVLLDTHTLLWWAADTKSLTRKVKRLIEDDQTSIYVSAASAWEIATKVRLGKLKWGSTESVESYCIAQRFDLLPISFTDGERAGSWPQEHGDPFDRMLAAQAENAGMAIATNDPKIRIFGVKTFWWLGRKAPDAAANRDTA